MSTSIEPTPQFPQLMDEAQWEQYKKQIQDGMQQAFDELLNKLGVGPDRPVFAFMVLSTPNHMLDHAHLAAAGAVSSPASSFMSNSESPLDLYRFLITTMPGIVQIVAASAVEAGASAADLGMPAIQQTQH